jgi:hypothetical protein
MEINNLPDFKECRKSVIKEYREEKKDKINAKKY